MINAAFPRLPGSRSRLRARWPGAAAGPPWRRIAQPAHPAERQAALASHRATGSLSRLGRPRHRITQAARPNGRQAAPEPAQAAQPAGLQAARSRTTQAAQPNRRQAAPAAHHESRSARRCPGTTPHQRPYPAGRGRLARDRSGPGLSTVTSASSAAQHLVGAARCAQCARRRGRRDGRCDGGSGLNYAGGRLRCGHAEWAATARRRWGRRDGDDEGDGADNSCQLLPAMIQAERRSGKR